MHQKLGDAYTQRANADEAWREYSHALQLIQEDPQVDRSELLCLYMRLAELSTRWLGWFNTPPDMQQMRSYIDAGLKLRRTAAERRARIISYLPGHVVYPGNENRQPSSRARIAGQALRSGQEALRIAEEVNDTSSLWVTLDALGFIYAAQHKYEEVHRVQHRRKELKSFIKGRDELHDLYDF